MADLRDDDATITALALAAGQGDRKALASFIRATQRDVHRFLVHLHGRDGAEDLAQETYLRAMQSLPRFAARSTARTWLLSIARRVAIDHVRAAQVRPRLAFAPAEDDTTVLRTPAFDERVALLDLVSTLDPERRDAFVLTQVLDLSYGEAADVCGCPVGTIRSRVARAREDLVSAMRERPEDRATGS